MTVYRFGHNSPIDEITVIRTEGGGARALIHAREEADPTVLQNVTRAMEKKDWQWTPMEVDGKPMLEVRGFGRKDNELLKILDSQGGATGLYQALSSSKEIMSNKDKLRKRTLQASGAAYILGDVGYVKYGYDEAFDEAGKFKDPQDFAAGIFYSLGSWFVAIFGKGDKSDVHLRDIARETVKNMQGKGMQLNQGAALYSAAESYNRSWGKKVRDFCEKFPSELTNGSFGIAGVLIMWSNLKKLFGGHYHVTNKTPDFIKNTVAHMHSGTQAQGAHSLLSVLMDVGLGTMTTIAGLISVFVREEKPDENEKKKTGLAKVWQKVKERPLRVAGWALGVSTMCHAGSTANSYWGTRGTIKNFKDALPGSLSAGDQADLNEALKLQKSLPWRAWFVIMNLLAEFLMSISSKGHGSGVVTDPSLGNSTHAVMADLLLRVPEEKREIMLTEIVKIISHKDHLGGKPEEHAAAIRQQMENLQRNPWAHISVSHGKQAKPQETENPPIAALTSMAKEKPAARWGERVSVASAPLLTPGSL